MHVSLGVIIFDSVRFLLKKSNQNRFFFFKTETGSNRPVSVWFGYFGEKTSSNRYDLVFSGLARFFRFDSALFFQFGFSNFSLIKPNRSVFLKF